jgi:hypothetical protein
VRIRGVHRRGTGCLRVAKLACACARPGTPVTASALTRIAIHFAGKNYRQGEACSDRSSRALRQTAAASGSMVGANSEAIRPSYGKRGR